MYYRDADACILVYDVTDKESFDNLRNYWLKELEDKAPESIQLAIVGNKSELTDKEQVTAKEAQDISL